MAARKKPETKPQLDASARAEPEDRKNRPAKASKPKAPPKVKASEVKEVQQQIDRAAEKIQADNQFKSSTGVSINVAALKGLCLRGPVARREELLGHIKAVFERIGVEPEPAQPFAAGKGTDNYPPIHDLIRWLDSIGPENAAEIALLNRCGATLTK